MKKMLLTVMGVFTLMACQEKEKTAYVDNKVLVQDFEVMKSTEERFNKKSEAMRKRLDSVARAFQEEVQTYQKEMSTLSLAKRQKREEALMQKQQILQRQQQAESNTLREESDQAIDSIITQVKDFVADYGKNNGYTYIFGSNETANIMYAKEGKDITKTVLEALNKKYGSAVKDTTDKK